MKFNILPMKSVHQLILLSLSCIILAGCSATRYKPTYFKPPENIDTNTKPIQYQEKKTYSFNDGTIHFDNQFDAARMNSCTQVNDSTFLITITPENKPINASPWFAFRIISKEKRNLNVLLDYDDVRHRYRPKLSEDALRWKEIPDEKVVLNEDSTTATLSFYLSSDTTWVAGQEVITAEQVYDWCRSMEDKGWVKITQIGESILKRPLYMLDSDLEENEGRPTVVILGRQHPPELTGFFALKAFVGTIFDSSPLSKQFLNEFRVIIYPMVNPDGVDLGHWRHNAGGVDLNRDWGTYNQPEVNQITRSIVKESRKNKSIILLGLDFHSTQYDVYYTKEWDTSTLLLGDFKDEWLEEIDNRIPDYKPNESCSKVEGSVFSNNWFYQQFNAIGITYEIGDNTPRDFIQLKGTESAKAMMELLLEKKEKGF
jgi:hypothetical protein